MSTVRWRDIVKLAENDSFLSWKLLLFLIAINGYI